MSRPDENLIRDADLRAQLEEHRGKFAFNTMVSHLVDVQAKRDLAAEKAEARKTELATMPRDRRKRAIIREVFENEGPAPDHLRFMHSVLAICGLPYRRLAAGTVEYERKQGRMALVVQAGKLRTPSGERVQQPIPYGPKARLLMAHLSTDAVRQNSATIEIADSLSAFMRDMGFAVTGGSKGTIHAFKEQINALAACSMEVSAWDGVRSSTIKGAPFSKIDVWMPSNPDQRMLWPSTITFSQDFFDELKRHALPMDVRALKAFAGSARKLDMLFWLSYRLKNNATKLNLSWHALQLQFGDNIGRERDFRARFALDMEHIRQVFPKLPVDLTEDGLVLHEADPTVLSLPRPKTKKR